MDRAHRIGQKKEVQVFRFCTEGSIEEKVPSLYPHLITALLFVWSACNVVAFSTSLIP